MLRKLSFSILLLLILVSTSCNDDSTGGTLTADQTAFLANTGENIILPAYQNLATSTANLKLAVETFNGDLTAENLQAIRVALKDARLVWQDCMMFDFGPASTNGLASYLNIYPVDELAIEQNIENDNFSLEAASASDQRGFQAMSYLIYNGTDEDLIVAFESSSSRRSYLEVLANLIADKANTTASEWQNTYLETFKTAQGTDVGSSLGQMVNAITQSMERKTRDAKLGIPVGLRSLGIPNPDRIEGLYAGYSVELAVRNLQAYKNLYTGSESGEGLLDYLDAIDAKTIDNQNMSENILTQLNSCIAQAQLIEEPLNVVVENNPDQVQNTIAAIQNLLVLVKTEMVSALGISITYQDNDGD